MGGTRDVLQPFDPVIVGLPHLPDNEPLLPKKLEKSAGRVKGSGRVS
jgi:hypothetical protein